MKKETNEEESERERRQQNSPTPIVRQVLSDLNHRNLITSHVQ